MPWGTLEDSHWPRFEGHVGRLAVRVMRPGANPGFLLGNLDKSGLGIIFDICWSGNGYFEVLKPKI